MSQTDPLPRQSSRVMAQIEVMFSSTSVQHILDGWAEQEVADLLSSNSEALDQLASEVYRHSEPEDLYVSVSRAEVEAYLEHRRAHV